VEYSGSRGIDVAVKLPPADSYVLSFAAPPVIERMLPTFGRPDGGETVEIFGRFETFDPALGDGVLFDEVEIPAAAVLAFNDSYVAFALPARSDVGPASQYDVRVLVDGFPSNALRFYYVEEIPFRIIVLGSQLNESLDAWVMTRATRFFAELEYAADNIVYNWTVYDPEGNLLDLGEDVVTDSNILAFPPTALDELFTPYSVKLVLQVPFGIVGEDSVDVYRPDVEPSIIGVSLLKPVPRTIDFPDMFVEMTALVEPINIDLGSSGDFVYVWTYRGQNYTGGGTPDLDGSAPSTASLGQTFFIPQAALEVGEFEVTLTVSLPDGSVTGTATTLQVILDSFVVAVINDGAALFDHNQGTDLVLSGALSYDPVARVLGREQELGFLWTSCEVSVSADFPEGQTEPCSVDELVNAKGEKLDVSSDMLAAMAVSDSEPTFYRFTLEVSSNVSLPGEAAVVAKVFPGSNRLEGVNAVRLTNHLEDIPFSNINTKDFVVIRPDAEEGICWFYTLVAPSSEAGLLQNADNLMLSSDYEGYWRPDSGCSRLPLGFNRGVLKSGVEYEFSVTYEEQSGGSVRTRAEEVLTLGTRFEASLVFPAILSSEGGTDFSFLVSAYSTVASGDNLFYFYLIAEDGTEICVGCTGQPLAVFTYPLDGTYRVRVDMVDALGTGVTDSLFNENDITITDEGQNCLGEIQSISSNARVVGDAGALARMSQLLPLLILNDASCLPEGDAAIRNAMSTSLATVNDISQRTAFTSRTASANADILCLSAMVDTDFLTLDSLGDIIASVRTLTTRLPEQSVRDFSANLKCVYNNTATLSVIMNDAGTNRRRILQNDGSVNNAMIDVYEGMREQLPSTLMSGESCGFRFSFDTSFESELLTRDNRVFPTTHVTVSVACQDTDLLDLRGVATNFSFCPRVFSNPISDRFDSYLLEDPDFVFLSGAQPDFYNGLRYLADTGFSNRETPESNGYCYTFEAALDSVSIGEGALLSYTMEPRKPFGVSAEPLEYYDINGFEVRTRFIDNETALESLVTRAGLYGATLLSNLISPGNSSEPVELEGERSAPLSGGAAVGVAAAVVGFVVIAGVVGYNVAMSFVNAAAFVVPPARVVDAYVEADTFGRAVMM